MTRIGTVWSRSRLPCKGAPASTPSILSATAREGRLYLGTGTLTASSMQAEYLDELTVIGQALSADGDILIYGCDFTAGDVGLEAAMILGGITGADIAASTDATGATDLGGDWDLETSVGSIQVEAIQPVAWEHVLAPIAITNLNGTTVTASTLADNIAGAGITVVSATYSGDNSQAGTFTSGIGYTPNWLAFDTGVIFSSGSTTSILGPNTAGNTTVNAPGTGTDADFSTIGGNTSFDASSLTITFVPTSNRVTLQFVLGSEEYNEYVYANFNDALGVWVNGNHVSLTPAGSAISINSINRAATYNPANGSQTRDPFPSNGVFNSASPSLFVNNTPNAGTYDTAMDGFTVTLTLVANVNIGVNNTIKIGIADIGDAQYNSWLLVRENSLVATTIANTDFAVTNVNTAVTINPLANDTDSDGDPLTITHVADKAITAGGPAVTLASGATVQLTVAGAFIYTPPVGYSGYEDFTYTISDGTGTTAVGFVHVDIGANAAPVIDLNDNGTTPVRDNTVSFVQGGAAVSVTTASASVIDPNDISYPYLNISLGGFQDVGSEIVTIGGTTFTYGTAKASNVSVSATSFSITYDGTNSFSIRNAATDAEIPDAAMEALIRSITYQDTSGSMSGGARTLSFQLSDGTALSNTATATVNVSMTASRPVVDLNSAPVTSELVTVRGDFGSTAQAAPPAPWVEGAATGAGAVVLSGSDGRWDWTTAPGATATLSYAIAPPASGAITSISFDMAWQNQDASNANTLTVSYNGVTYATFTTLQGGTANAAGLAGTWVTANGASISTATVNSVTDEVTGAMTRVTITLPLGVTAAASLQFTYGDGAGAGTNHDDIAIDNVSVSATAPDFAYGWTANYVENGSPVTICDVDSSVFDADSANIASATVTLTNPEALDRLLVNGSSAASGTLASGIAWTRTDTSVSLSGTATKDQYAAALRLIQFENTGDNPGATVRLITITVSDGTNTSNTAVATINVTPVNDAPVGVNDTSVAVEAGGTANGTAGSNATGNGAHQRHRRRHRRDAHRHRGPHRLRRGLRHRRHARLGAHRHLRHADARTPTAATPTSSTTAMRPCRRSPSAADADRELQLHRLRRQPDRHRRPHHHHQRRQRRAGRRQRHQRRRSRPAAPPTAPPAAMPPATC